MNEERRRVTICRQISINVSVKWLGVSIPFYDTAGVPWIDNILVSELRWGDGGGYKHWASKTCSRPRFGGRRIPGVAISLSVPITFPVVWKIRAQGRAASVTFACGRTV